MTDGQITSDNKDKTPENLSLDKADTKNLMVH